ncbi:MAG TPA: hypothetical protein VGD95_02030 [Micavibrio sp.]
MATTTARRFASANNNCIYDATQDPRILSIGSIPKEFRAPTLGESFLEAADDPYQQQRGARPYEPAALWNEVIKRKGNVDSETARLFVNDYLSGVFANDAQITDKRAQKNLASLGFEMVITLYESISQSTAKGNSLYLQELNRALNLPDSFYQKRIEPMARFYDPRHSAALEQQWAQARADGRLNKDQALRFADAMAEELTSPPIWSAQDAQRRVQLLQFLSDAYSDSIGEKRVRVGLFKGQPGLKGFYSPPQPGQEEVSGLNVTELSNFQACINIVMHERQHASQNRLAEAYEVGLIKKRHPDYMAARIFAANGKTGGYINGNMEAGHRGYRFQPMEQDAHNAGSIAEYMAFKTYARKPDIYTERSIKAPIKAAFAIGYHMAS